MLTNKFFQTQSELRGVSFSAETHPPCVMCAADSFHTSTVCLLLWCLTLFPLAPRVSADSAGIGQLMIKYDLVICGLSDLEKDSCQICSWMLQQMAECFHHHSEKCVIYLFVNIYKTV